MLGKIKNAQKPLKSALYLELVVWRNLILIILN